jgi:hypothetical protein
MYLRGQSTILSALVFVLLAGLLAGCGGGEQSGNGPQDGGGSGAKEEKGRAGAANKGGPEVKIALGRIAATDPERRKIVLRPTAEVQGGEREIFIIAQNAEITLGDKEAELADIEKGQQAQISYTVAKVVNKDTNKSREVNRARDVSVFRGGEGNKGKANEGG